MILAAPKLALSTSYILAGLFSCPVPDMPDIKVVFHNPKPVIDNTQNAAALAQMRDLSISPNYGGEFPTVDGINNGGFEVTHSVDFEAGIRPILHDACVSAKKIEITVTYNSTIYINSVARPNTCRYDAILEHEMKHVQTDVSVMKDYLPFIEKMTKTIAEQWRAKPMTDVYNVEQKQDDMSKQLTDALNTVNDNLQKTRLLLQPLVDTEEEYRRISATCEDKTWKKYLPR